MRAPCRIDGCEKESRGRGLCATHWARWRKYGDPLFVKQRGVDWQVKTVCSVEGCDRPNQAKSLCSRHYARWAKHGDPLHVEPRRGRPLKGDVPTSAAIHRRLRRTRGRAGEFACVDCGRLAAEWSYNNADPDELYYSTGSGKSPIAYSLDLTNYDPRCISCHRTFDSAGSKRLRNPDGTFADPSQIEELLP